MVRAATACKSFGVGKEKTLAGRKVCQGDAKSSRNRTATANRCDWATQRVGSGKTFSRKRWGIAGSDIQAARCACAGWHRRNCVHAGYQHLACCVSIQETSCRVTEARASSLCTVQHSRGEYFLGRKRDQRSFCRDS